MSNRPILVAVLGYVIFVSVVLVPLYHVAMTHAAFTPIR